MCLQPISNCLIGLTAVNQSCYIAVAYILYICNIGRASRSHFGHGELGPFPDIAPACRPRSAARRAPSPRRSRRPGHRPASCAGASLLTPTVRAPYPFLKGLRPPAPRHNRGLRLLGCGCRPDGLGSRPSGLRVDCAGSSVGKGPCFLSRGGKIGPARPGGARKRVTAPQALLYSGNIRVAHAETANDAKIANAKTADDGFDREAQIHTHGASLSCRNVTGSSSYSRGDSESRRPP